jgi:hypothetical protein
MKKRQWLKHQAGESWRRWRRGVAYRKLMKAALARRT